MASLGPSRFLNSFLYKQLFVRGGSLGSLRCCFQNTSKLHLSAGASASSDASEENSTKEGGTESEQMLAEKDKIIAEKEKTATDFKDKYLRALAENENIITRNKKLMEDTRLYGIQSFAKDLLEVADILEKATESVPKEELTKNTHLKNLFQGLSMTETQLQKVFQTHGLEKIDPVGEKFDPNFHDALFMQPFPDKEPGTVAVVTKIGYKLHGRPLRAALVGVVKS